MIIFTLPEQIQRVQLEYFWLFVAFRASIKARLYEKQAHLRKSNHVQKSRNMKIKSTFILIKIVLTNPNKSYME